MLIHMKFTCLIEIETCDVGYLWMHKIKPNKLLDSTTSKILFYIILFSKNGLSCKLKVMILWMHLYDHMLIFM